MFKLDNKVVLITGASSGLGRQCAITASKAGASVILIGRDTSRLNDTLSHMEKGNHLCIAQDVVNYDAMEQVVADAVAKLGPVSGLVYSAGIEKTIPLRDMLPEMYNEMFNVNVIAGFHIAKLLSKKKNCHAGGASFIFISSIMGSLGQKGKVAYCATKGALIAGSKAIALELAPKRIRVNCILPAVVETEMTQKLFSMIPEESKTQILNMHPLGVGRPIDIANACLYLLSDEAKWITATSFVIDGGYSAA